VRAARTNGIRRTQSRVHRDLCVDRFMVRPLPTSGGGCGAPEPREREHPGHARMVITGARPTRGQAEMLIGQRGLPPPSAAVPARAPSDLDASPGVEGTERGGIFAYERVGDDSQPAARQDGCGRDGKTSSCTYTRPESAKRGSMSLPSSASWTNDGARCLRLSFLTQPRSEPRL
jgi:hypothetical protein